MKLKSTMSVCALIIGMSACLTDAIAFGVCSVTSVSLSSVSYNSTSPALSSGIVNWTCSRSSQATDGNISFAVTASAGENYNSASRHVSFGASSASLMSYTLATSSAKFWGDPITVFGSAAHLLTDLFPAAGINTSSGSIPFTFSLNAGFNPIGSALYTDTIFIDGTCSTSNSTACTVTPAPLTIGVNALASCTLSAQLPTLSLNYTSFQTSSAASSVMFTTNCTNATPYRINVSPGNGTMLGLPYSIKLGTSGGSATDISSTLDYGLTGTGFPQTYYINGSIAAGLAGICATGSCTASTPHNLNIEY